MRFKRTRNRKSASFRLNFPGVTRQLAKELESLRAKANKERRKHIAELKERLDAARRLNDIYQVPRDWSSEERDYHNKNIKLMLDEYHGLLQLENPRHGAP